MERINSELNQALNDMALSPGVTPADIAAVRSAMLSDADLVNKFNQHAALGRVTSFAASDAASASLVGSFDASSRTVIVGSSSLASESNALVAGLKVQEAVVSFANKPYSSPHGPMLPSAEMVTNLESVLNGSPALARDLRRAVNEADPVGRGERYFEAFAILPDARSAGATFDKTGRAMSIPANALLCKSAQHPHGYFNPDDLTFVIGHEVEHAFSGRAGKAADDALVTAAMATAKGKDRVHDYTDVIGNHMASHRIDESRAEIAGWNALLSRKQMEDPSAGLQQMAGTTARVNDFMSIDRQSGVAVAREGLTFEPDGYLAQSAANIEAMGQYYFDQPAKRYAEPGATHMSLGVNGEGDYRAHYSRSPIQVILEVEDSAKAVKGIRSVPQINMAKLGLHEDLIEEQGLNLGKQHHPRPYLDSSRDPSELHYFDHTIKGSEHPFQYRPIASAKDFSSPLHQELQQLLPAGTSEDRIAQIALAAKQGGIEAGQIRTLDVQGDRLMMTGETAGTRAIIDLSDAPPPAQESNQQFQATEQAQQQMMQEQQIQAQNVQQSGPAMSMGM